jgi:amino acid transporter
VIAADELVAVTNAVQFRYDDGKTFLTWVVGENVNPAVWISVFLVLVIIINMFPVKVCIDLSPLYPSNRQELSSVYLL